MARRTKIEMEALDQKIRPLYERGIGCRIIGEVLKENPVIVLKRVRKMGIARNRKEADSIRVPEVEVPFTKSPSSKELPKSSVATAIQWFMARGYMVSIPVEPARYDLVVESDVGLKKVQVKSTTQKDRGRWSVRISRKAYDASRAPNAGGKTHAVPYTPEEVDLFFVVTGDQTCYLIPLKVVSGQIGAVLENKFEAYKLQ